MSPARSCLAVTTVLRTVVGTLLGSGTLPASAVAPPGVPLAECTDLAITFSEVGDHTFTATVTATVTVAGIFSLNGSHGYFGQTGRTTSTLRATVPSSDRLTELLGKAAAAAARDQGAVAVRQLGLAVDELRSGGLPAARKASARIAIAQAAHVLGHAIPRLHTVRPGEHLWSIVRAQLVMDTGHAPSAGAVADAVRRTQAANPRLGALLQPGVVLVLPGFSRARRAGAVR